jgi:hypothetical protein
MHYLHIFMMQLLFIIMMSIESPWFCIMIGGVLELFLCLNMKITTFELENTIIVVYLIGLSPNINNTFSKVIFLGPVDWLLLFFLWVVFTCVLICLVLLMDGFTSLIFIYRIFLLFSSTSMSPWFIRLSPIPSNSILFTFWLHWATRYGEGIWSN